jgi:hypothetical protein
MYESFSRIILLSSIRYKGRIRISDGSSGFVRIRLDPDPQYRAQERVFLTTGLMCRVRSMTAPRRTSGPWGSYCTCWCRAACRLTATPFRISVVEWSAASIGKGNPHSPATLLVHHPPPPSPTLQLYTIVLEFSRSQSMYSIVGAKCITLFCKVRSGIVLLGTRKIEIWFLLKSW